VTQYRVTRYQASQPKNRTIAWAAAAAMMIAATPGHAQQPQQTQTKTLKILVGFAAGGPADIVARLVGTRMGEILGQGVVIENRGGAGGYIATEAAARAEPDGTTILMTPLANAANEAIYKARKIKYGESLTAVAAVAETANVLVVHPSLGANSVAALIALAKSKPGDIVYASAGRGTATHLTSELFNLMAGVKLSPVHYRGGGETIRDLLSGEVKVMFSSIPPVLEFIKENRLIGVATTGPKRDAALPGLPTVAESGLPGFDMRLWLGFLAPSGTPRPTIDRLAASVAQSLKSPDTIKALAAQGFDPLVGGPDEFDSFMRGEIVKWGKVVEAVGITPE